jgi:pimeloyl-ACP methyl ester carboxylesterase
VAVGSNGKIGWAAAGKTPDQVRNEAMAQCTAHGGVACRLYAEDLDIVWPGREQRAPAVPGPLASTMNYAFVPDARFFWHGPAAAAGVIVWSHGKHGDWDSRGVQPPPVMRAFNNAGFDIVRFDRAPMGDSTLRAAGWLQDELPVLRRLGYRRVVAAGQSRGAWTSLQMLDTAGLVDAVIALSPAAHGSGDSMNLSAQDDDLRALVSAAEPAATRVAVAQFSGDPFMSDADIRKKLLERLRPKLGAVLLIDRPAGFSGHFGGIGQAFSERYASCLLRFVLAPSPPATCPGPEVDP